eukprot:TRINITY_DN678_c0_g1_i4.p2 TRINITY_DN678_c0_g1~~TRINITY_DN678_c0_g1_i4.p2  ORF type:complete len:195 (-),score=11.95 TRINITY_DN678_c0_g1_i4:416-1000(-)
MLSVAPANLRQRGVGASAACFAFDRMATTICNPTGTMSRSAVRTSALQAKRGRDALPMRRSGNFQAPASTATRGRSSIIIETRGVIGSTARHIAYGRVEAPSYSTSTKPHASNPAASHSRTGVCVTLDGMPSLRPMDRRTARENLLKAAEQQQRQQDRGARSAGFSTMRSKPVSGGGITLEDMPSRPLRSARSA